MKKRMFCVLAATLFGFGFSFLDVLPKKGSKAVTANVLTAKKKMSLPLEQIKETPEASIEPSLETKSEVNSAEGQSILNKIPSDQKIVEDLKKSPHHVPASLVDFSVVVADKMKMAKKSVTYAEALFSEFRTCAVDENSADHQNLAVRVYCLANAKRLASWYPVLSSSWVRLSEEVSINLLEMVQLTPG